MKKFKYVCMKTWFYIQRFFTRRYKHNQALKRIGVLVSYEYKDNKHFKKRLDKMGLGGTIERILTKSLK